MKKSLLMAIFAAALAAPAFAGMPRIEKFEYVSAVNGLEFRGGMGEFTVETANVRGPIMIFWGDGGTDIVPLTDTEDHYVAFHAFKEYGWHKIRISFAGTRTDGRNVYKMVYVARPKFIRR
jgi:hypothetical protein